MNGQDKDTPTGPLAAFGYPSFRFQFVADTCVALALEMEVLILGWYVLVETDSAFLLALIGVARFGGTLLTPFLGSIADKRSRKGMLIVIRSLFSTFALILMTLAWADLLAPWQAFVAATLTGLIRSADLMLRQSLIADSVPPKALLNAMAFARSTFDGARIVGAIAGASLMATLGIGTTYLCITIFYVISTLASLGIQAHRRAAQDHSTRARPLRDLVDGLRYVHTSRRIELLLGLAFVVNLSGLCITGGLLPLVARDVYGMTEIGLGFLLATFAGGALVGSLLIATALRAVQGERLMLSCFIGFHAVMIWFALNEDPSLGFGLLAATGLLSSFVMVPMSSVLLIATRVEFRARVMGLRQLAVIGLPLGLLIAGGLVEPFGVGPALAFIAFIGLLSGVVLVLAWWRLA
ncbi:MAG: MFS transporter [Gammaproteobacteria bacterium]|nr:MFS transporter [Gammaproteobacteria bacterium]